MAAPTYDVLIIGSGASGGMAAHTLTKKGINCVMLDAGPQVDFNRDRVSKAVYDLPYRGFGKPGRLSHVLQANEFNANQWWTSSRSRTPIRPPNRTTGSASG